MMTLDKLKDKKIIATRAGYGDDLYLDFADGSKCRIYVSYDACYYESDRPRLGISWKADEAAILRTISELDKWFKKHPKAQSTVRDQLAIEYFDHRYNYYVDHREQRTIYRDTVEKQVRERAENY